MSSHLALWGAIILILPLSAGAQRVSRPRATTAAVAQPPARRPLTTARYAQAQIQQSFVGCEDTPPGNAADGTQNIRAGSVAGGGQGRSAQPARVTR